MQIKMKKTTLLTSITALFLATGSAHADLEGYARCADGIVGTGRDENGTELWGLVRWKKSPRKLVIEYDRKTNTLTVNGKRCVWID
jgi:hypothetical protein